jgi:hypothetical protein
MAPRPPIGTCLEHGKMLFRNRKIARRHARRVHPGARLSAYECATNLGMWHYGHLPEPVTRGELSRKWVSTRRIDVPEQRS